MMRKLKVEKVVSVDRERICELARINHAESLFAEIAFSRTKFYKAFENTLQEPDTYLGLKVTFGDEIVGFCYALVGGYYIGEETKVVTVIAIVTSPAIRTGILGGKAALRLTRGVEIWARGMGASYLLYHATAGINPTGSDRFFRKLGMTTLGGNYGLRLSDKGGASG